MAKKKTNEEFVQEVFKKVGTEYTPLTEYVGALKYVKMRHNCKDCNNYEWPVAPAQFIYGGTRCPVCSERNRVKKRTKTQEEFIQEVYDLVKDEYTVLGTYTKSTDPILMRHNVCGREYEVESNSFLHGARCKVCKAKESHKKQTKSHEKFCKEVYDLVGCEYDVIEHYINSITPILVKHNTCGNIYPVVPQKFLLGRRCPECSRIQSTVKRTKTQEQFEKEVFEKVGNEYSVLGEYTNTDTHIQMRHNCSDCNNHEYPVTPAKFLNGTRCPECFGTTLKTTKEFKQEVYNLVQDEYTVLGEYINSKTYVKMRHNKCNHEYNVKPSNFTCNGNRCPECNESKGEREVDRILTNKNVVHDSQYSFPDLLGLKGGLLAFDVPVFHDVEKKQLWFLIEYDGEFHYEPIMGKKKFKTQQIHDKRKDEYCLAHSIPLLRIPYWEFDNIESIINNFIKELSNSQQDSSFLIAK